MRDLFKSQKQTTSYVELDFYQNLNLLADISKSIRWRKDNTKTDNFKGINN